MTLEFQFGTTRSRFPSPLTSPIAMDYENAADAVVDRRSSERAVAIPQQDRDGVGKRVGDRDVELPVAADVAESQRTGGVPATELIGVRAAGAVPRQDRDGGGSGIQDRDVELAVAVEVPERHRKGVAGGAVADRCREVPFPFPRRIDTVLEQLIGDREVGLRVPADVPDRNRNRAAANAVVDGCRERAVSVSQHRHRVGIVVGDREVWFPVPADVRDRDRHWGKLNGVVDGRCR